MALQVGAGGAHITPPIGFPMGGYGARDHGAEGVHDHLNTHALFLDDGGTQVIVISSDLLGMRALQIARVRELVTQATGVPESCVFLAFTHTHGGPLMYSDFGELPEGLLAWQEALCHYMAGAALQAATNAIPVRYGYGRRNVRIGANRRERAPDGSTRIGVNPDGPIAPWVDVLFFDHAEDCGTLGLFYHHAVHGTSLVGDNYLFTADSMGYAMRLIEQQLSGSTALFLNGCAGNINPHPRGNYIHAERHGTRLGAATLQAIKDAEVREGGRVRCAQHRFELPLEDPPSLSDCERQFAQIEPAYLALQGEHHRDWSVSRHYFAARDRVEAARKNAPASGLPVEVQAIAIDDIAMVSLPGEIFVETGFAIADASPFAVTMPVGYANGSIGYIPTREEIPFGGYEVIDARARYQGRYIREDAAEVLTQGALEALDRAYGG
ncbi:MAG: hypothetical protein VX733_00320 [Candidatus Latescibacterota bacterium]|nr:hypothetical protein [Candidatus Latescibacterota bacterium]